MHIHALANQLRVRLPKPLWEITRKIGNLVLGPCHFSLETGHFRSSLKSLSMDRHGEPLPWYTYPAIQFLLPKDFGGKRVLEWGGGQSTLFWAKRAREIVVFESDSRWFDSLLKHQPDNIVLHLIDKDIIGADALMERERFDIIVVDGLDRWKCAERSPKLLAEDGAIIVDDSERTYGPGPRRGIADLYRQAGLSRLDFYGYSPGNATQHCTSIFFKRSCFLINGRESPQVTLTNWSID